MSGASEEGDPCRTADGLDLFAHDWTFPGARAVLAVAHGFAEHGGRYEHVARELRPHGIATLAVDLRGHGRSPGPRGHVARFGDYQADLDALLERAGTVGPPVFLLGHSMGALVVLDRLRARPDGLGARGAVLSSPYLGLARRVSPLTLWAVARLATVLPRFPLPAGLAGDLVCRDRELRREYDEDPLVLSRTTAGWFVESRRAIMRVERELGPVRAPLLVLAAGDDHVADVERTRRLAARAGFEDRLEVLPGVLHEVLNEPPERRRPIIERMADWVGRRLAAEPRGGGDAEP